MFIVYQVILNRMTIINFDSANYHLTEMCELLISMWTAWVLVTKTVVSIKALRLLIFAFSGFPSESETRLAIVLTTNKDNVTVRN